MKYLCMCLLVAIVAAGGRADARPASTMASCRAACGDAISSSCGWIAKHHRFQLCQQKLLRQCKRFGVGAMCPAPAQPTPTTTLPPPPVTTTTVPYVPPTTTTLPPPPPVANLLGSYEFEGYITVDNCGALGIGTYTQIPVTVTGQSGTSLSGLQGANDIPVTGTFTPSTGGWNLGAGWCLNDGSGCCEDTGIGVGADTGFAGGVPATWFADVQCPTGTCSAEADGLLF